MRWETTKGLCDMARAGYEIECGSWNGYMYKDFDKRITVVALLNQTDGRHPQRHSP